MNIYWWIEKSNGKLLTFGRRISDKGEISESGLPRVQKTRLEAHKLCYIGEKPVKVKLTKV